MAQGVQAETRQALTNMGEILKASGSSLDKVLKTTVFLRDMNDFNAVNEVYATVRNKEIHFCTINGRLTNVEEPYSSSSRSSLLVAASKLPACPRMPLLKLNVSLWPTSKKGQISCSNKRNPRVCVCTIRLWTNIKRQYKTQTQTKQTCSVLRCIMPSLFTLGKKEKF